MNSKVFFDKLTALLLLLAVAGSTFNKGIALLDYRINGNYIACKLCENMNKPQSSCHGKCFLKKQMEKDESGKSGPASSRLNTEITWFFEHENSTFNPFLSSLAGNDLYLLKSCHPPSSSIFHPPTQTVSIAWSTVFVHALNARCGFSDFSIDQTWKNQYFLCCWLQQDFHHQLAIFADAEEAICIWAFCLVSEAGLSVSATIILNFIRN